MITKNKKFKIFTTKHGRKKPRVEYHEFKLNRGVMLEEYFYCFTFIFFYKSLFIHFTVIKKDR